MLGKYCQHLVSFLLFAGIPIVSWCQTTESIDPEVLKIWSYERSEFLSKNRMGTSELFRTADQVIGIELIIAGPLNSRVESQFGHALLRFVRSSNDPIEDSVLSFSADVNEPILNYNKGAFGGYSVIAEVSSFGEFIQKYLENEERPLFRYIIPTTPATRQTMIAKLYEWVHRKEGIYKYKFATKNCAGVLLDFLHQSGVPTIWQLPVPSLLPTQLNYQYLSPYPPFITSTLSSFIIELSKSLSTPENQLRAGRWPKSAITKFRTIPIPQLTQLYYKARPRDVEVAKAMREAIESGGQPKLEYIYGVKSLPSTIYSVCGDRTCAESIVNDLKSVNVKMQSKGLQSKIRDYMNLINPVVPDDLRIYIKHGLLISASL